MKIKELAYWNKGAQTQIDNSLRQYFFVGLFLMIVYSWLTLEKKLYILAQSIPQSDIF